MLDVEPLLADTGTMPPSGVDLEYDAEFLELDVLASDKPTRLFHQEEEEEEPPWREMMERASTLLGRSKDLRLAITYTRSAVHVAGLSGFHAGLRLLAGLLERHWEGLYPPLDEEMDNSLALRVNALAALADPYTPFDDRTNLLNDLRAAEVCRVPGEHLSVRDILIAIGKQSATATDRVLPLQTLEAVLEKALKADPQALADALALPHTIKRLISLMGERFGAADAPSLTVMLSVAQNLAEGCHTAVKDGGEASDKDTGAPMHEADGTITTQQDTRTAPASAPQRIQGPGRLATREDAMAMLDAVCTFLERTEPTNPAPLLIRRARALMGKDFIAILQDLAPDSLAQIHQIVGKEPQ